MKQLLIIIGAFLILCNPVNAQGVLNREELGLKGNVKSIKETSYIEVKKFGEIVKEKERKEFWLYDFNYIFNEKGDITKKYEYNSDGILHSKYTFKYNKKKEITANNGEEALSIIGKNKLEKYHNIYKYDNRGNIVEHSYYKSKTFLSRYTYKYSKEGNKTEENYYKSIDELKSKKKFIFNDKGNVIEEYLYKSNGELEYKYLSEYDDKGNKIKMQTNKPDGSLVYRTTFEYDIYGNIISGRGYTYKYEYDKNGNWISKIEFLDNVQGYIIEREIVYF